MVKPVEQSYDMPCVICMDEGSEKYIEEMQRRKAEMFRDMLESLSREELIQLREIQKKQWNIK